MGDAHFIEPMPCLAVENYRKVKLDRRAETGRVSKRLCQYKCPIRGAVVPPVLREEFCFVPRVRLASPPLAGTPASNQGDNVDFVTKFEKALRKKHHELMNDLAKIEHLIDAFEKGAKRGAKKGGSRLSDAARM